MTKSELAELLVRLLRESGEAESVEALDPDLCKGQTVVALELPNGDLYFLEVQES
jgi:hypothetical protein